MVLAAGACAFGKHAEQFALPVICLKVSAGHTTHGPPIGPE